MHQVLIDDGLISMTVTEINGENVKCKVNNGGMLGGRKGVNLPGTRRGQREDGRTYTHNVDTHTQHTYTHTHTHTHTHTPTHKLSRSL